MSNQFHARFLVPRVKAWAFGMTPLSMDSTEAVRRVRGANLKH